MPQIIKESQKDKLSVKHRKDVEEKRKEIYRSMSAEEKWAAAAELYYASLALKKAHLQRVHSGWSQTKIDDKAKEWMLYART